jgi:hypothetical protein
MEELSLADVVAGTLPPHIEELIRVENAWRSFGAGEAS